MTKDEILDLLIKAHYGIIDQTEQASLDHLLRTSELARKVKQEAGFCPKEEAIGFVQKHEVDHAEYSEQLMSKLSRRRTGYRLLYVAAAVLIAIIVLILLMT